MEEKLTLLPTLDSYTNQATDDEHLFRVVDREGDWTYYFHDELNRYLPAVNHILQLGFPKGQGLIQWLKKMDEAQAEKILNSAAERGARVHSALRMLISGETLNIGTPQADEQGNHSLLTYDEWDCITAWVEWAKVFKPKVLKHETAVFNKKIGYAGTTDFIGSIEIPAGIKLYIDDKLTTNPEAKRVSVLLDWKTGGTYDDHKLQIAAYAGCLKTRPTGEFFTGIVRLGTKHQNGGFEIKLWSREKTKFHFSRFQDAKKQFDFVTGGKEWQPDIVKIPLTLKIEVPQLTVRKGKNEVPKANPSKRGMAKGGGTEERPQS